MLSRVSGSRDPSLPLPIPRTEIQRNRLDSEVSTPPPFPRSHNRGYPLPGFGSLTECHPYITASQSALPKDRAAPPLPRFLPLQRLSASRSHVPPAVPISPVLLRPQGFSPSRRLAPLMAFRAYSIPVPLMGFHPSRLCSSPGAVRLLRRRAPRGFLSTKKEETAPPGTRTPNKGRRQAWRLNQDPTPIAPLGFPAPRFLALSSEGRSHALSSPLALLRLGRKLTSPLAPQGFAAQSAAVLSRDRPTPLQFSTSLSFSTLWKPRRAGLSVPLRGRPMSP
jgi:hypothetical protein